jgi:hypothetical protein
VVPGGPAEEGHPLQRGQGRAAVRADAHDGPHGNRVRAELLGAGPRVAVPAGPGGGEFADYDGPRPVHTAFVTEDEARQLVTR